MKSTKNLSDFAKELNDRQFEAMVSRGTTLVLAGPGTGKTRVIIKRIQHLIKNRHIQPDRILALSFTKKATEEMKARLEKDDLGKKTAKRPNLCTIHKFCREFLKEIVAKEKDLLPIKENFKVAKDKECRDLLINMDVDKLNKNSLNDLLFKIGKYKNQLGFEKKYQSETTTIDATTKTFYKKYQEALIENNLIDLDDYLVYTYQALKKSPEIRRKVAERYDAILIDEFQDTNTVQYEILKYLSVDIPDKLFMVGDEDQSIYAFRGADYKKIQQLEQDFTKVNKILLVDNYRSTQLILDAAKAVIDHNTNREEKALRAHKKHPNEEKITLIEANDEQEEAETIAKIIKRQTQNNKKIKFGDFAILYRNNYFSEAIEDAFEVYRIPYHKGVEGDFLEDSEVEVLIDYLRLIDKKVIDEAFYNIIVNCNGIGDASKEWIKEIVDKKSESDSNWFFNKATEDNFKDTRLKPENIELLISLRNTINNWQKQNKTKAYETLKVILPDILNFVKTRKQKKYKRVGSQLLTMLKEDYPEITINKFLDEISKPRDLNEPMGFTATDKAVSLLTFHGAKGLEFKRVFLICLNERVLPDHRSKSEEEIAEERRLFYVGMTRAEEKLFLTRPRNIIKKDRETNEDVLEKQEVSRFIEEIRDGISENHIEEVQDIESYLKTI